MSDISDKNKKNKKESEKVSGGSYVSSIVCPFCGTRFFFKNSTREKYPKPICTNCHNKIKGLIQIE